MGETCCAALCFKQTTKAGKKTGSEIGTNDSTKAGSQVGRNVSCTTARQEKSGGNDKQGFTGMAGSG